jgi:hypothetical protein
MIQIPVFNDTSADWEQSMTLGTQELTLRTYWNARSGYWFLDIYAQDGTPKITGRKLVPALPVCYSHRAIAGIEGDFVLLPETEASEDAPTFEGLGSTHNLYWMDDTELNAWEAALGIQ